MEKMLGVFDKMIPLAWLTCSWYCLLFWMAISFYLMASFRN